MSVLPSAGQLVQTAYFLAELLGGERDARRWLHGLSETGGLEAEALPSFLSLDNRRALLAHLGDVGLLADGHIDRYRADELSQVMELIPLVRASERARLPRPQPSLVCTLPAEVIASLPGERRNLGRSLENLVLDALRSATEHPVLIASPYWSAPGCARLRPALARALERALPVTLVGARPEDEAHHAAMLQFAHGLAAEGFDVRALRFNAPKESSLCHAKLVCGETGYLGSGNITAAGLESHVEVGMPLTEVDVHEAWWILGELERAGLLEAERLS